MRRFFVVFCLLLTSVTLSSAASAASIPRGAVALKSSSLKKVGTTQCGKVKGFWVAGKVTKVKTKNYFLSHSTASKLFSADAKKSRGAQRLKFLRLAKKYKTKASVANKKCLTLEISVPDLSSVPGTTTVPLVAQELKFDIDDAAALALTNREVPSPSVQKSSLGSNLEKVDASGNRTDAVIAGVASIRRFLIAPNNKLYVEFLRNSYVEGSPCLLAEVSRDTGSPKCIERDKDFMFMGAGQDPEQFCNCSDNRPLRNDIQFDKEGNIYYAGIPGEWKKEFENKSSIAVANLICSFSPCGMASVVRRYSNGVISDFGPSEIGKGGVDLAWHYSSVAGTALVLRPIQNFLVLENGNVLIHAHRDLVRVSKPDCPNCYNEPMGTDLWSSSGQILARGVAKGPSALLMNADSKSVLVAAHRTTTFQSDYGLVTFDEANTPSVVPIEESDKEQTSATCNSLPEDSDYLRFVCFGGGVRHHWRTPKGEVFIVVGQDPFSSIESYNRPNAKATYESWVKEGAKYGSGVLLRLLPSIESTPVGLPQGSQDLTRVETFTSALDHFYANGLNQDGQRLTIAYNTSVGSSEVLIPSDSEIRITKMTFSSKSNALLFSGVQGSQEQPVFGIVDQVTKKLTISNTSRPVSDLQAFSS